MYKQILPFPFATICFCLFLTRCSEGLLWLVVDVAEWHDFAADLPSDAKRCTSTVLSNRQAFLKADVRNRHKVALRRTCSALSFCLSCVVAQIFGVLQQLISSLQQLPAECGHLPPAFIHFCEALLRPFCL